MLIDICVTIHILWKQPKSDGGFPINSYFVQTLDENNTEVSTATVYPTAQMTYIQNKGILSNKKYTVRIRAVSEVGKGDIAESSVTTQQFCEYPFFNSWCTKYEI